MLLALLLAQDPAALVERLRSDDIEERERAEAQLVRCGATSVDALIAASEDSDPEVASRVRRLLWDVVAPHRRDVARYVAHLARHAGRLSRERRPEVLGRLTRIMRDIDSRHAFGWDTPYLYMPGQNPSAAVVELTPERLLRGLRYPGENEWSRLGPRAAEALEVADYDERCSACVIRRLSTFKLGIAFQNATLVDVLTSLRDVGGVRLVLDAMPSDEARDLRMDRAVTIEAKDVTLSEALKRLLEPYDMGYRVMEEEGVVLIGPHRKAE